MSGMVCWYLRSMPTSVCPTMSLASGCCLRSSSRRCMVTGLCAPRAAGEAAHGAFQDSQKLLLPMQALYGQECAIIEGCILQSGPAWQASVKQSMPC